jgi:hypothetical protein
MNFKDKQPFTYYAVGNVIMKNVISWITISISSDGELACSLEK